MVFAQNLSTRYWDSEYCKVVLIDSIYSCSTCAKINSNIPSAFHCLRVVSFWGLIYWLQFLHTVKHNSQWWSGKKATSENLGLRLPYSQHCTHHITLLCEYAISSALWWHPPHRKLYVGITLFPTVVVSSVDVLSQTKISYFDQSISINPTM